MSSPTEKLLSSQDLQSYHSMESQDRVSLGHARIQASGSYSVDTEGSADEDFVPIDIEVGLSPQKIYTSVLFTLLENESVYDLVYLQFLNAELPLPVAILLFQWTFANAYISIIHM